MPKRKDINKVMVIGSGPIVIGQAAEFDYAGTQACLALKEEGYEVILVNSNPATIMTDTHIADKVYMEPLTLEYVAKIIRFERPDAIVPGLGGQTGLNLAVQLAKKGILKECQVEILGTSFESIERAEDRELFKELCESLGEPVIESKIAMSVEEAVEVAAQIGYPVVLRPAYTLGGTGGGFVDNEEQLREMMRHALFLSPVHQVLVEKSIKGYKEIEFEVMRDHNDTAISICCMENIDPVGVHTGDSIVVAPCQTLTNKEFQMLRDSALKIIRELKIEGGCNVQFALDPLSFKYYLIEVNPRVSRSSALASKATGFPIAKVAAKLAVGYTLDELMNDITGGRTPASFEPSIDYVVTKIPRFNFEKFAGANDRLTTQMKSVGEVMAIGRTQQESLQKALRGLEVGATGFDPKVSLDDPEALTKIRRELKDAGAERIWYIADAFRAGLSVDGVFNLTNIDRWFLVQIEELVRLEEKVAEVGITGLNAEFLRQLKRKGFADARLAKLAGVREAEIRKLRDQYDLHPVYKRVDTCAAEFATDTAYMYSTYEEECEANPSTDREKIMVLGGGPNRIGQGIEFDYCCVHASLALREDGYETIMVNCNPETVSTDYDTSDRLYFEPVTLEDVLEIVRIEKPKGVIVQYGGQTPLKLARALEAAGVPVIGTSPDAIDRAEDRERFQHAVDRLKLKQPANATVTAIEMAVEKAKEIGYPLVVRPSYVLGGRAMEIVYDEADLRRYFQTAVSVSNDAPVLLDHFLDDAVEVDVDAICDGEMVLIGGIMEHIEQAGVHSGDSACSLPAYTLSQEIQDVMRQQVQKLAFELQVRGLMNVQFAVKNNEVYLIEVNPRAARTVPFVSKATGVPLAKVAARVMAGKSLAEQGVTKEVIPPYYSVKEVVLPFNKFPGVDPLLGPEMRSTGEVMGVGRTFAEAFAKAQLGSNSTMKKHGRALLSVREGDKERVVDLAAKLLKQGFELDATHGTAIVLGEAGINPRLVNKVHEGRPHIQDRIKNGEYTYIINTTSGRRAIEDSRVIRRSALQYKVHYDTTLNGGFATAMALNADATEKVISVQEMHAQIK